MTAHRMRILAVDDEPAILDFLDAFFERRHERFETARDGEEALSRLSGNAFDVLITDLYMPRMDGHELVRRARAEQPNLVCVVLTGQGNSRDSIAAIKEGVFDYIEKPVRDIGTLSMSVDRACERARMLAERARLLADLKQKNAELEINLSRLNDAYERLMKHEEAMEADLRRAQRMQQSLLPSGFPHVEGWSFFGFYCPCERLAGDFFDIIPLRSGRAALYLADVAGHGVRSALVTVILRELIHAQRMLHPETDVFEDPARALRFLNRGLMEESFDDFVHVTMGYAVVDDRTGQVTYGCAGHPRPLLVTDEATPVALRADGPALGVEPDPRFLTVTRPMRRGDLLLIYSDGLADAQSAAGETLSVDRLRRRLSDCRNLSPRRAGAEIERLLFDFQRGAEPLDDVSFLTVSRDGRVETSEGELQPRSVRIVNRAMELPPRVEGPTEDIRGGWAGRDYVVRLDGVCGWRLAGPLKAFVEDARDEGAERIHLDLRACESLDSTLLGVVYSFAADVDLRMPEDRVRRQLREMGILDRMRLTEEPPPPATLLSRREEAMGPEARRRMILDAHERLANATPEGRARLGPVVEAMRQEPGGASQDEENPEG